ncbi:hypothetical protein BJ875DRAFT_446070 [Amylocarpus encephaloides]|uniref:Uncharacterized protein n=1 Tax=Amylocarpus encephaloides TaxID=45428 RepID=A0A9P7Y9X5_9HELO|nr:hypothetical protein BJ875DRAFT_446070 [Amylocarpus encephaloides]
MKVHAYILSLCTLCALASAAVIRTSTPATGLHFCRCEDPTSCVIEAHKFHNAVDPLTVESAASPVEQRQAIPEGNPTPTTPSQVGNATERGMWGLPKGVSIIVLVAIGVGGLMLASLVGGAIAGLRWLQKRQMKIHT